MKDRVTITLKEMNEKMGYVHLLVFDRPEALMNTQYGRITHGEWIEREYDRIMERNTDRECFIVTRDKDGAVGLYVDRVACSDTTLQMLKHAYI